MNNHELAGKMVSGYFFAILTGIFWGLQGTFGKVLGKKLSPPVLTWGMFTFTLPFMILVVAVEGVPPIVWNDFLWSTAMSFTVNIIAWNVFFYALQISDLSHNMPFTAFTPLFLIPVAFVLLGELPDEKGIAGILLIILSGYGIHLQSANLLQPFRNLVKNKGSLLVLFVAMIWSLSATAEKVAVLSSSQAFYGLTINLLLSLAYTPYIFLVKKTGFRQITKNVYALVLLGFISGLLLIFQFTALKYLLVSYVIAFKRAGIVVSVLLGILLYKEKNPVKNLSFTILMVLGVFLILT